MNPPTIEYLTGTPPAQNIYADSIKIYLGGKSVKNKIQLENSMLEDELVIQAPRGTTQINLAIDQQRGYVHEFTVKTDEKNVAIIKVASILRHLPFQNQMTLTVASSGKKNYKKRFQIQRSTAGIAPDPARAQKSLLPLYQQIANDFKAGKPLVITANVVLWDASFNGRRRFPITDGNDPKHNLYWGAGYGMYHGFKNVFRWKLVGEEKDKVAVFKKVYSPNPFWQGMGVKKPFEVYVVLNLYKSDVITDGYRDFAKNLFGNRPQRVTLKDGKIIEAGSQSRIVGYIGHMTGRGKNAIKTVRNSQSIAQGEPKGVFMTSCLSAPVFSHEVLGENTYGLLFTTGLLAPEAYIQNALFDAIARGLKGDKIIHSVASAYANYHDIYPGRLFVTSESPRIEDYSSPYEGDSDGDGIDNRIDPEPGKVNLYERSEKGIVVTTSSGKRIEISLEKEPHILMP